MTARRKKPAGADTADKPIDRAAGLIDDALDILISQLEAGHSEQLQAYLAAMPKFRAYSFNNIMLILAQQPAAQHVAGYRTWRKLNRQVRKGERGIIVIAPMVYKKKEGERSTDRDDGDAPSVIRGFRAVHVFDISQTNGEPLPSISTQAGDPGQYIEQLERFITGHGITLNEAEDLGGADGVSKGGEIVIRSGMHPARRFAVLAHEVAHELMHKDPATRPVEKETRELEAEAVAHVVCYASGLDPGQASSDYIQLYSGDKHGLLASLEAIRRTARIVIDGIDGDNGGKSIPHAATTLGRVQRNRERAVYAMSGD